MKAAASAVLAPSVLEQFLLLEVPASPGVPGRRPSELFPEPQLYLDTLRSVVHKGFATAEPVNPSSLWVPWFSPAQSKHQPLWQPSVALDGIAVPGADPDEALKLYWRIREAVVVGHTARLLLGHRLDPELATDIRAPARSQGASRTLAQLLYVSEQLVLKLAARFPDTRPSAFQFRRELKFYFARLAAAPSIDAVIPESQCLLVDWAVRSLEACGVDLWTARPESVRRVMAQASSAARQADSQLP